MRTNFVIRWSKESKFKFDRIILYLRREWTNKEVHKFIVNIRNFEHLVVKFPELYAESNKERGLRRAVLSKHNSVIYKIDKNKSLIMVYTILDNREQPEILK